MQNFFTSQKLFTFKHYLLLVWAKVLINSFILNTVQFSFNPLPGFIFYFPDCFTYIYFSFICLNCDLLLLSLLSQSSANLSLPPPDSRAEPAAPLQLQTPSWEHLTPASSPPGAHKHPHFITAKLLGNYSSYPFYKWRIREGEKNFKN